MASDAFQIVALGCMGGPRENNLSGYLLSPLDSQEWVALDAGTLLSGIDLALERNSLKNVAFTDDLLTPAGEMLIKHLRAFLISHAHLDHILAMVVNSQADTQKYVLGSDTTIDNLRDHIFNGKIWPNYGSEGADPILNCYRYFRLPFHLPVAIPGSSMTVEAYLLSHPDGYPSTAFLIRYQEHYILYFGDTTSDSLEKEKHLLPIWRRIAPLIREKKLRGILLECSYPERKRGESIFGHLDSKLMMTELCALRDIAGVSLEGFKVMVAHRKESLEKDKDMKEKIRKELLATNDLKIDFIFPCQGDCFYM